MYPFEIPVKHMLKTKKTAQVYNDIDHIRFSNKQKLYDYFFTFYRHLKEKQ